MSAYHLSLAALALATISLGGCIRYQHIPPHTAEGLACVQRCDDQQRQCRDSRDASYREFKGLYDIQNQSYQNCLHTTEDPNLKTLCPQPTAPDGPDYQACTEVYDSCFTRCGGRIERVK
ncbi:hypothetical protein SAMN05216588_11092 [Pseudomonas flavescens]|uniref:Uncharacterized protein n=1 Tax=Phytopseudomonas flavescens TaxID=29435 RepID=A0A1G8H7L5_9GAMM|nr:hypothetical protein [Pseudomonas flavescens]SDI02613.1 hypothetical protein SAMN05216588_11092 [Pseudomonas flavescens]